MDRLHRGDRRAVEAQVEAAQLEVGRVVHAEALAGRVDARGEARAVAREVAVLVEVAPLAVEAARDPRARLDLVRDLAVDVEVDLRGEAVVARVVVAARVRRPVADRALALVVLDHDLRVDLRAPAEAERLRRGLLRRRRLHQRPLLELLAPGLEELLLRLAEGRLVEVELAPGLARVVVHLLLVRGRGGLRGARGRRGGLGPGVGGDQQGERKGERRSRHDREAPQRERVHTDTAGPGSKKEAKHRSR